MLAQKSPTLAITYELNIRIEDGIQYKVKVTAPICQMRKLSTERLSDLPIGTQAVKIGARNQIQAA